MKRPPKHLRRAIKKRHRSFHPLRRLRAARRKGRCYETPELLQAAQAFIDHHVDYGENLSHGTRLLSQALEAVDDRYAAAKTLCRRQWRRGRK